MKKTNNKGFSLVELIIVIAIMARSTIFNKEIDMDLAQHIVHGVVHNETKAVTIDDILKLSLIHI